MSHYENENTRNIVSRLGILTTTLKTIVIAAWIVVLGSLLALLAAFFGYWWLGAIIGILLGYGFGLYFASMLILVVEWMAQILIAQEEKASR
jgi:hypothetical protein